jgi:hypothetical protein
MATNWLQVLGTTEFPLIDQGIRQQFHAKVSLLQVFKTKQHSLEFILPRKSPVDTRRQCMDGGIEEPFVSALGDRDMQEDKFGELGFRQLHREGRCFRIFGSSAHQMRASWEEC